MKRLLIILCGICSTVFAETTLDQYRAIVVSPKASTVVKSAAGDLQYYLQKVAGREIPIIEAASGEGLYFFVGPGTVPEADGEIAALPPEGWMVKSVKQGMLLGGNDQGTYPNYTFYHAIPHFLKTHCGVRWLWPGKTGEVIPTRPGLKFAELDEKGAPTLKRRKMDFNFQRYWTPEAVSDLRRWERNSFLGDQVRASFAHAWAGLFKEKDYETHPEWFALVDGKRLKPTKEAMNWQLCLSNPEMRDEFYKRLTRRVSGDNIVSISPNDGGGFCECEACRKAGPLGELYWEFATDLATRLKKDHPKSGIGSFAYTFFRQPPQRIEKLPDNIYLSMTTYSSSHTNAETKAEFLNFLNAWKSKCSHIFMREYWGMHYWHDLPILYTREIANGIRIAYRAGLYGVYGEAGKNWSTQAPNYYMLTNLMWNPEADPDAVMEEFYDCFGPAKPAVRAYYELLEKRVGEMWARHNPGSRWAKNGILYGPTFTPELMAEAAAHLEEASRLAGDDAALQARINELKYGCEYTTLMGELFRCYNRLQMGALREDNHVPLNFSEQKVMLEKAWELGQRRIELVNRAHEGFALDEGLFAKAFINKYHREIAALLGKPESAILPMIYTRAETPK